MTNSRSVRCSPEFSPRTLLSSFKRFGGSSDLLDKKGTVGDRGDFNLDGPNVVDVCLIGDQNVGKTALGIRLLKNVFNPHTCPTVGGHCDSVLYQFRYHRECYLCVRDVSGHTVYHSIVPKFLRGANVIILMFDLTSRKSFENLPSWESLLRHYELLSVDSFILCGNKFDRKSEHQVTQSEAQSMCDRLKCTKYIEISAMTGFSVWRLRDSIFDNIDFSTLKRSTHRRFRRSAWSESWVSSLTSSKTVANIDTTTKIQALFH